MPDVLPKHSQFVFVRFQLFDIATWSTYSAALSASPSRYRDMKQFSADRSAFLLTALLHHQLRIVGKQGRLSKDFVYVFPVSNSGEVSCIFVLLLQLSSRICFYCLWFYSSI